MRYTSVYLFHEMIAARITNITSTTIIGTANPSGTPESLAVFSGFRVIRSLVLYTCRFGISLLVF